MLPELVAMHSEREMVAIAGGVTGADLATCARALVRVVTRDGADNTFRRGDEASPVVWPRSTRESSRRAPDDAAGRLPAALGGGVIGNHVNVARHGTLAAAA